VLHTALFLFPLPLFTELILKGAVIPFVINKLLVFAPLYTLVFLMLYSSQSARGERWRSVMEKVFACVPLLGSSLRKIALARLATALDALLAAGINVLEAWEIASKASGSPRYKRAVAAWRPDVENGVTPAEAMSESGVFPDFFANVYHSAEISGRQEEALQRLYEKYYEDGVRELRMFCKAAPAVIYMAVVAYAGYHILHFYKERFDSLDKI
jgi:type II secretory pathway component PulF